MMLNDKPYECKLKNTIHLRRFRNIKENPVTKEKIVVEPADFHLDTLLVFFHDLPQQKMLFGIVREIDSPILLFKAQDYDKWKERGSLISDAEARFDQALGEHPELFLQAHMPRTLDSDPNGPGTILSGMLSAIGIKSTPNCTCRQRAVHMNAKGNDWCEKNMDEILTWLSEEAKKRRLPFVKAGAKLIVQRAIKKSRRLLKKYGDQS
tara:strand:- start:890 stop:1513 length:624 start_codon:yes stop_codon:yes gene_type:complete